MHYSPFALLDDDVIERASRVRLLCLAANGALTDGRTFVDADGRRQKAFHETDARGLALLLEHGIQVAIITTDATGIVAQWAKGIGIEVHAGIADKPASLRQLRLRRALAADEVAYIGGDLPDLACMQGSGLAIAPADAHSLVAESAQWLTRAEAGHGAVREACDGLLAAQGRLVGILQDHALKTEMSA